MTFSAPPPSPDLLLLRFEAFIEALCRCVAGEGSKNRIAGPLVVLLWTRLHRLAARFARLATQPPAQHPRHRSGKSGAPHNLPRGFGWVLRLMPGSAAIASQFRHLLAEPEMTAFIAANPPAGRILRPLCHTLGIRPPPILRLPRRLRPPRPAAADDFPPAPLLASTPSPASPFTPCPDIPGWPRAPGATRFFRRRPALRA